MSIDKQEKATTTKKAGEKRVYRHVMPKEDILISLTDEAGDELDPQNTVPESEADIQIKYDMLNQVLSLEQSQTYYWRVVFSYTFLVYRVKKQRELLEKQIRETVPFAPKKPLRKISLKNMAEDAAIDYYKVKRLFQGKGNADNVLQYIMFLNRYNISFVAIASQQALIKKAYRYYQLVNIGINPEDSSQLKF